jgi:hypothetical protein
VDFVVVPERFDEPFELVPDPLLHLGRLGEDDRACVDAAAHHTLPELIGVAERLDERDGADADVGESRVFEQAVQFLVVREPLPRGADWSAAKRLDPGRSDRVGEQADQPRPLACIPLRDSDAPGDAGKLCHDPFRALDVVEQERGDGGVERVVRERELLGIAEHSTPG